MKMKSAIFAWMTLMLLNGCGLITPGQKKSVSESQKERPVVHVPLADPFILLHDGTYTLTEQRPSMESPFSSPMICKPGARLPGGLPKAWPCIRTTYTETAGLGSGGLLYQRSFYMFFSAQSHVCVAVSDSPLGPFVQKEKKPMIEGEKCIDNTLFIDDDGRKYMYFDRFNDGLNIWMCELENNLLRIKPGTKNVSMFPRNGRPCGRG